VGVFGKRFEEAHSHITDNKYVSLLLLINIIIDLINSLFGFGSRCCIG